MSLVRKFGGPLTLLTAAMVAAACGSSGSRPSTAAPNDQSPPSAVLNGTDLNLGSGVVSSSSLCQDKTVGETNRQVVWRGVTNGPQPQEVGLMFFKNNQYGVSLFIFLSNGEKYDNSMKGSHITVSGPVNGVYQFSGTVMPHLKPGDTYDPSATLDVRGSIACANYGTPPPMPGSP